MATSAVAANTTAAAGAVHEPEEDNPVTVVTQLLMKAFAPAPKHHFDYDAILKIFVCSVKLELDDGTTFEHKSAKHPSKKEAKKDAFKRLLETLKNAQQEGQFRPNTQKNVREKLEKIRSDPICQFTQYVKRVFLGRVKPQYTYALTETGFRCTVAIPMGDTMTELAGNDRRKKVLAKRSTCEMALEHLKELFPLARRQRYYTRGNLKFNSQYGRRNQSSWQSGPGSRSGWASGHSQRSSVPQKRRRPSRTGLFGHEVPSGQNQTDMTAITWNSPAVSCESGSVTMLIDQFLYLGSIETADKIETLKNLNVQFVLKLVNKSLTEKEAALNVTVQTDKDITSHVLGVRDAENITPRILSVLKEAAKSIQDAWESDQGVFIAHGSNTDSAAFVAVLWLILYQNFGPSTAWNFVCLRNNESVGSEDTLTGTALDEDGDGVGAKLSWFKAAKACKPVAADK